MAITRTESISPARPWTDRVLDGIAILFLCAILYGCVFVPLSAGGAGPWSVDAWIRRARVESWN
jgi:hypothetical protein